jgi:type II restriction/modification system DNA methylase subunit YeeA
LSIPRSPSYGRHWESEGLIGVTPREFIKKWQNSALKERAAAQAHFLDICRLLDEQEPADVDPTGKDYGFEVGASKTTGGQGFADVFKRGCFAWEYKGTKANLDTAFAQLQRYAVALDNPPLLIVSDIGTMIRIHTNWTNSVSKVYEIAIGDLEDPEKRGWLKASLSDPDALRPTKTRQELTEEVAGDFARLARSLRDRGHAPEQVAHFINRLVFCMFAEDVKLLPDAIFTRMLERALEDPAEFESFARDLFTAMKAGGRIGFEKVAWFNGGLFDDDLAFALTKDEIKIVHHAASRYWGDIDPSILGTLFERGLDPDKRSQLGAHYTDRDKIMMIVNPVIVEPLTAEWETARTEIAGLMEKAASSKGGAATRARNQAQGVLDRFMKRLSDYRVLDPACGSGNFLYLALRALKDLEHRAQVEAEALGLPRGFPRIGPEVVKGIEINPYAAELARVSVWIGEIQWMLKNGFAASENPILKSLDNIECRDAVLTSSKDAADWPQATVVIGNPPFLGNKKMNRILGGKYVSALRAAYSGRVTSGTDLVMYWFKRASELLETGQLEAVGLVGTQAVRRGANRKVLDKVTVAGRIFNAWSDEKWTVDGASVRVSLVCFDRGKSGPAILDGKPVNRISSDLVGTDERRDPQTIVANRGTCFQGTISGGPFEIPGTLARAWISSSGNPNGRSNADVLRPWRNADDITGRCSDAWIIFFPDNLAEAAASLYEKPFEYLGNAWLAENTKRSEKGEKPLRDGEPRSRTRWWLLQRSRPKLWKALQGQNRYIVTSRVGKHRVFTWLERSVVPDTRLVIVAKDCDVTFGVLQSRPHTLWSLRYGARHGVGNDPEYVHTKTYETFPFPESLAPDISPEAYSGNPKAIAIADAARRLNELRETWLNPSDLVRREPEVVSAFPDRILPVSDEAEKALKRRTLTNLYNERPAWLDHAHQALDEAVAAAYGIAADLSDEEILSHLFALNQERTECKATG